MHNFLNDYIKNTWNSSKIKTNIEFGDNLNYSINNHSPFSTHVLFHCLEIKSHPFLWQKFMY
jgi:hypothetical protein